VNIPNEIERLKSKGDYYAAGRVAGANGQDDNYGCHFGMRSTLETARALYKAGHQSGRAIIELERRAGRQQGDRLEPAENWRPRGAPHSCASRASQVKLALILTN